MTPGVGARLHLPQPYADAGIGSPPVQGEGYSVDAPAAPAQVVSDHGLLVYGRRPVYGDDLIGGVNFQGGRSEPAVRHVHDVGDGRLLIEARSAPADGFTLVSPSRPGVLARLLGRIRGRR